MHKTLKKTPVIPVLKESHFGYTYNKSGLCLNPERFVVHHNEQDHVVISICRNKKGEYISGRDMHYKNSAELVYAGTNQDTFHTKEQAIIHQLRIILLRCLRRNDDDDNGMNLIYDAIHKDITEFIEKHNLVL